MTNSVYGCTEVLKERFLSGRAVDAAEKQFLWIHKDLNPDWLHLWWLIVKFNVVEFKSIPDIDKNTTIVVAFPLSSIFSNKRVIIDVKLPVSNIRVKERFADSKYIKFLQVVFLIPQFCETSHWC